ncbi:MAG TPA: NAD(P)/FAD-dependent oxidoreductase [Streptosporangiaceae bacterium]|nr:NAD(P)/FAD-dependent oxidoreductase [Streptosporangiaceae bacterium]
MSDNSKPHAVIVGAGLAGLACASDLAAAGATVTVLEAGDAVGGRMRTDRRAGFLLDRGFQVFNTSYPQVQRRLDLRALQLCAFTPGMLLHTGQGRARFADPTRRPAQAADILLSQFVGPRDLAALGVLSARDMLLPARLIKHGRERTTIAALASAGISRELIEQFFRPFLAGVFLEDELETSSRFFHLVWRSMLRGTLCLPRRGIQAVPDQLAAALPPGTIQTEAPVSGLTDDGVLLADGNELRAGAVVVAAGPAAAAQLLPGLDIPATRIVTTLYHAAAVPPLAEPTLLVDTERTILHTSVLTEVTRGYSGDGRALISSSVLGEGGADLEPTVRGRLAALYETETAGWEHLATYTVEGALPAMVPPQSLSRPCRVGPRRYVCGDHRATGSVQGALASGARAAREILADA